MFWYSSIVSTGDVLPDGFGWSAQLSGHAGIRTTMSPVDQGLRRLFTPPCSRSVSGRGATISTTLLVYLMSARGPR